jgi:Photosynthetic reaction centre cytochrome C subunit
MGGLLFAFYQYQAANHHRKSSAMGIVCILLRIKPLVMIAKQHLITFTGIVLFVASGIAATRIAHDKPRNLKILTQDISDEKLDSIMGSYNKALGVDCNFCHAADKKFPDRLDLASDEKPMKEEARKMMRMTIQLNKDYFYFDSTQRPEYLKVVTCITCHRGDPMPVDLK